ncbi:hypothetical protein JCM13580A_44350 [Streptomyces drozdowiczii]
MAGVPGAGRSATAVGAAGLGSDSPVTGVSAALCIAFGAWNISGTLDVSIAIRKTAAE